MTYVLEGSRGVKVDNAREKDYWPREGENVVHR